jgi:L-2,4-diaminobutyrate decarboxylase
MTRAAPVWSGATPEQIDHDLRELVEFRAEGMPLDDLAKLIEARLQPHLVRYDHPGFQAFFNTVPDEGGRLGTRVLTQYNPSVTNWFVSPGGAALEELSCRALCRLFGLGPDAEATFLHAGTYANQLALYLALCRHAQVRHGFNFAEKGLFGFPHPERLAVAVSEDAHFSARQAARMLGLGEERIITLAVDSQRRIDVAACRQTLQSLGDRREVFCVVATAGTTATGAIDPIASLVEICRDVAAWLHVDGAYGLAYRLVPEWSDRFAGIAQADSISWDPHKQLGVVIPSSLLFLRRREDFAPIALFTPYFYRPQEAHLHPGRKSPPSTRPLAALPLVASLRHLGLARLVAHLRTPLLAVKALAEHLAVQPDFELCHQPDLGVLCFRCTPEGYPPERLNQLQESIRRALSADGARLLSWARLGDREVLRVVSVAPTVTFETLRETIDEVRRVAASLALE